jgi:hypothetical protein
MKIPSSFRRASVLSAVVVSLAACGAGGGNTTPALSIGTSSRSWMNSHAKSGDLMYVSNTVGGGSGTARVTVYSLPSMKLVGTLTGFKDPQGECVDKAGDVYVTDITLDEVFEYAHGGTSPIKTLSDASGAPVGCAVNPLTGDLAVSNFYDFSGSGGILIYPGGSGNPTQYDNPNIYYYYLPCYDNKGDLFVVGLNGGFRSPTLAELSTASDSFTTITLNQSIGDPGDVQWHGKYLAVGDQSVNEIYQFKIAGSSGKLKGTTDLGDAEDVFQFWIVGNEVIGADNEGDDVGFWPYPAGGSPIKTLNTDVSFPEGVTLSKAAPTNPYRAAGKSASRS